MNDGFMEEEPSFRQWVEQSSDFFQWISLSGRILYASPSLYRLLCFRQPLKGEACSIGIAEMDVPHFMHAFRQMLQDGKPMCVDYRMLLPDGSTLWVQGKADLIYYQDTPIGAALIARDISKQKQVEERLTHMAYYDSLTGLPNRRLFQDRYTQAIVAAKRYQHRVAVLYLDLDDFKLVNDQYGHAAGDELLKASAIRLANCVREPDTVSRVGGDEFIILLQQYAQRDDIRKVALRIIDTLKQPYTIQGHTLFITCSIGAAEYPQDGTDKETLLHNADAAMYQAKLHGKNYFHSQG